MVLALSHFGRVVGGHTTPRRTRPARYFCIVASAFVREQVDPRIQQAFRDRGLEPDFGDIRKMWRKRHCATLNPYGFEDCPYAETDCALAYLSCITNSVSVAKDNPMGYFWRASKTLAISRADSKPLMRERDARGPGDTRSTKAGDPAGREPVHREDPAVPLAAGTGGLSGGLRGRLSRPEHIGALLGSLDLGSREGRSQDVEEGHE